MFITFEGSEGSGKSTQIQLLAEFLGKMGFQVTTTREPGGTRIGEQVRACLHDISNKEMTAAAEVLLYSASRSQLVEEVIRPALANNNVVLSDRYADSTIAYQGYGRKIDINTLLTITRFATGGLKPDLTLLLDVDVQSGLKRRSVSGEEINRMDMQTIAFYESVRDGYLKMASEEPERWRIIDANRSVDMIQECIRQVVLEKLQLK